MTDVTNDQILRLFRENLRRIRTSAGLTQTELAQRIGLVPGYICDLERGRRSGNGVSLTTLAKLAEALDVEPALLISTARTARNDILNPAAA